MDSNRYGIRILVREHRPERLDAIVAALTTAWRWANKPAQRQNHLNDYCERTGVWEDAPADPTLIYADGSGWLSDPRDFASDLAEAVLAANGDTCQIKVKIIYLEDCPYTTLTFGSPRPFGQAAANGLRP